MRLSLLNVSSLVQVDDSWTAACAAVCARCAVLLIRWTMAGRLRARQSLFDVWFCCSDAQRLDSCMFGCLC